MFFRRTRSMARSPIWRAGATADGALTRTFRFADFARAVDFVEQLADVAESMQHHPDIDIRYNKVTLRLGRTVPAA